MQLGLARKQDCYQIGAPDAVRRAASVVWLRHIPVAVPAEIEVGQGCFVSVILPGFRLAFVGLRLRFRRLWLFVLARQDAVDFEQHVLVVAGHAFPYGQSPD